MLEQDLERIGTFFFLSLLDEPNAIQACQLASTLYSKKLTQSRESSSLWNLVSCCEQVFRKFDTNKNHGTLSSLSDTFSWPENIDPSPWREFYRQTNSEHRNAVIWFIILEIPIEDVARGLSISTGTVRYRCGQAMASLGKLTRPSLRSLS